MPMSSYPHNWNEMEVDASAIAILLLLKFILINWLEIFFVYQ